MKRIFAFFALAAIILAGATSCKDKFKTSDDIVVSSEYVITKGVDIDGNNTNFIADMHALVANSVTIDSDSFENGDIGFEYGKDKTLSGEVMTVIAEQYWTEEGDPLERKGFSARAMPLPPGQVFFYRAFLKKDGKKEYGLIFSFRTDDAMVTAVYLNRSEATLKMGETETLKLTATIDPAAAANKEVDWSSSDDNVASVNSEGLVSAHRPGNADIKVTTREGGKTATCKVTVKGADPKAVDLGLSVKWADINVGAGSETDPGCFYRWGDTRTAIEYSTAGYIYYYTTEYTIPDSIAGGGDDAAYVNMGSPWRMPTKAEMDELLTKCEWTRENVGGMEGWRVSRNGKSIFLPFGGQKRVTAETTVGTSGFYWTASKASDPKYLESVRVWYLSINNDSHSTAVEEGHVGYNVRAVRP